jgi:hypothetical protein
LQTLRLANEAGNYNFVNKTAFWIATRWNTSKIAVINALFGESPVRFQKIIPPGFLIITLALATVARELDIAEINAMAMGERFK